MTDVVSPSTLMPALVGIPLIAAVVSILLPRTRLGDISHIFFASLQLTIAVCLGLSLLTKDSSAVYRYALGGWQAPLGIDLALDGFSAIMLLLTAILCLVLTIYSMFFFRVPGDTKRFWPLWWLLFTGLNALFLAADAFNIFVALELISLSAVSLVAVEGTRAALIAALRYLFVSLLGSVCYLLGVALIYRSYGLLDLSSLSQVILPGAVSWCALALISLGLLLKTALLPLHFWLPSTHGSASPPVSAVLSALVVKASFYLLARYWLDVLYPATTGMALQLLGVLGACAIMWGSYQALQARRLKYLVAYSTVAQLGYLFLLFPLVTNAGPGMGFSSAAFQAVGYFIVAHGLAKAAMFLAVGNIKQGMGHDNIDQLKGIAASHPLSVFTFAIAGASLIGLPPSGGFIAKWLLLNAAIEQTQWLWVFVIVVGGLGAALYVFRVLSIAFDNSGAPIKPEAAHNDVPARVMAGCGVALAVLVMLWGFSAQWGLDLLLEGTGSRVQQLAAGVTI